VELPRLRHVSRKENETPGLNSPDQIPQPVR
jgi:hypothetical protein